MRYIGLVIVAICYLAYVSSDACVQCNSSNDPKCATNPEQFFAKDCKNNTNQCYVRVLNGETIRGCGSDLDNNTRSKCNNEMECVMCSFMEGCNRQTFPTHRAQCIQCSGNVSDPCALNVFAKASVCSIYKLGDKCYIRNTGKNTTNSFERGCLSSAHDRRICVKEGNCYTCEGAGCNMLEANSSLIPMARDSAAILAPVSLLLLLVSIISILNY